jgi:hypothetical protein
MDVGNFATFIRCRRPADRSSLVLEDTADDVEARPLEGGPRRGTSASVCGRDAPAPRTRHPKTADADLERSEGPSSGRTPASEGGTAPRVILPEGGGALQRTRRWEFRTSAPSSIASPCLAGRVGALSREVGTAGPAGCPPELSSRPVPVGSATSTVPPSAAVGRSISTSRRHVEVSRGAARGTRTRTRRSRAARPADRGRPRRGAEAAVPSAVPGGDRDLQVPEAGGRRPRPPQVGQAVLGIDPAAGAARARRADREEAPASRARRLHVARAVAGGALGRTPGTRPVPSQVRRRPEARSKSFLAASAPPPRCSGDLDLRSPALARGRRAAAFARRRGLQRCRRSG